MHVNLIGGLGWLPFTNVTGLGTPTNIIFPTTNLPQAFFQIQAQ